MTQVNFSQLKPISSLPRHYATYISQLAKKGSIILMKKNKPTAVLVDFKWWQKLEKCLRRLEDKEAWESIQQSEKEIREGKIIRAKSLADL